MWGMPGKQSPTSNTTLYRFWTRHAIPMRKLNDPVLAQRSTRDLISRPLCVLLAKQYNDVRLGTNGAFTTDGVFTPMRLLRDG